MAWQKLDCSDRERLHPLTIHEAKVPKNASRSLQ